jgi:hypothetical protein
MRMQGRHVTFLASFFFALHVLAPSVSAFRQSYSWHSCSYSDPYDALLTTCLFKNVCFQQNGQLLYFHQQHFPLFTSRRFRTGDKVHETFPDPLLFTTPEDKKRFKGLFGYQMQSQFKPDVVRRSLNVTNYFLETDVVVLFDSFWPENFGHAMGDDFFRVWKMLRRFGFDNVDDVLIANLLVPCNYWKLSNSSRACLFHDELARSFSQHRIIRSVSELMQDHDLVCAKFVVAGSGNLGMMDLTPNFEDMFFLAKRLKQGFNIIDVNPTRHKIVFMNKTAGEHPRSIRNGQHILDYLKRYLQHDIVELDVLNSTIQDQISLVNDATVLITPDGGISYTSLFLPLGASVLHIGIYDNRKNESELIEHLMFDNLPQHKHFFYPLQSGEVCGRMDVNSQELCLDLRRMLFYVKTAIFFAENFFFR